MEKKHNILFLYMTFFLVIVPIGSAALSIMVSVIHTAVISAFNIITRNWGDILISQYRCYRDIARNIPACANTLKRFKTTQVISLEAIITFRKIKTVIRNEWFSPRTS